MASTPNDRSPSGNAKTGKVRCPHCQTINQVAMSNSDQVFRCSQCEQDFRIRPKAPAQPPPAPVTGPLVLRFPVVCRCKARLMVTNADFGKTVTCKSCKQTIKIPDWVAEKRYSDDEFDDMFSDDELQSIQQK